MKTVHLPAYLLFALTALSAPCQAGVQSSERLARIIIDTHGSADILGFLRDLPGLGDVHLDRDDLNRAMRLVGTTSSRAMADLVYPMKWIRVRDGWVEIERDDSDTLFIEGARLQLEQRIRYRVVQGKHGKILESPRGISMSAPSGRFYRLKWIRYTRRNGVPVAELKGRAGLRTKRITISLPSTLPFYAGGRPAQSQGLTSALGGEAASARPSYGDRGPAVLRLQRNLNADRRTRGQAPIAEDGIFGSETAVALGWYRQRGSWPEDFPPN